MNLACRLSFARRFHRLFSRQYSTPTKERKFQTPSSSRTHWCVTSAFRKNKRNAVSPYFKIMPSISGWFDRQVPANGSPQNLQESQFKNRMLPMMKPHLRFPMASRSDQRHLARTQIMPRVPKVQSSLGTAKIKCHFSN